MRNPRKKSHNTARIPRARNAHSRQRQRLIDACISALHIYGPSRTTVEKVVAIAKMSPGIVRFYFASKAAMLVASLQFLSAEFEEQLLMPVSRLKSRPVAALELLVDLYLDPEIASPRKVSVWYAFWGEASSRQEYYDICGQKDESFAALVRELIERLIVDTSQLQLDPDGIALGLIGVLEMLWQDFAFRTEADIDRARAKRRALAYLRSIFPGQFTASLSDAGGPAGDTRLAGWVYADARLFGVERESLFRDSWQLVAHQSQIPGPGDFLGIDLGVERVLVVRGAAGAIRAFRNSCTEAPHILNAASGGHVDFIQCMIHGLQFDLDGRRRGARGVADLTTLDLRLVHGLILVRAAQRRRSQPNAADPWIDFSPPPGVRPLGTAVDASMAADWKLIIEQWLESTMMEGSHPGNQGWSARSYRHLLGPAAHPAWQRQFVAPNHLVELRPDGFTMLQVLPSGPGHSVLRRHDFTLCEEDRVARAARYVASRLNAFMRQSSIAVAESTQKGIVTFGHQAADGIQAAAATAAFRRHLVTLIPMMALARPPNDL
ncbi:MAG TPA: TetR family transcriptional regulator C-terminal domain-containing protein [Steroidobacteraceae bacterium]|jgi:TetR/AcrR family transcriptional repressor of bet genes|nr:TetR family transcriptional regulator C-terminal domain-containing protein [Steroidobacteraceae bacterium]